MNNRIDDETDSGSRRQKHGTTAYRLPESGGKICPGQGAISIRRTMSSAACDA